MYRLYYEEISGTFFVGDDVTIDRNLTVLTNKLTKPNGSFSFDDYCKALDIGNDDPFGDHKFKKGFYDFPHVFDQYLGERSGIMVMCVGICTN